jgi:hypothetical protein
VKGNTNEHVAQEGSQQTWNRCYSIASLSFEQNTQEHAFEQSAGHAFAGVKIVHGAQTVRQALMYLLPDCRCCSYYVSSVTDAGALC